jgi:hypothetical protein
LLFPFNWRVSETFQQRRRTATSALSAALLPISEGRGTLVGPPSALALFPPGRVGIAVGSGGDVGMGVGVKSVICKIGVAVNGMAVGEGLTVGGAWVGNVVGGMVDGTMAVAVGEALQASSNPNKPIQIRRSARENGIKPPKRTIQATAYQGLPEKGSRRV